MPITADVCVLGGGPGGYVAALRATQLGAKVVLVEAGELGGVCLNRGCIPSKTLLRSAEVYQLVRQAASYGVRASNVRADYPAMVKRKDRVVRQLVRGVHTLLESAGVELIHGWGQLAGSGAVEVSREGIGDLILAPRVIVATGSSAAIPPIPGSDLPGVIDSDGAFGLSAPPGHIVVAGAGAVGVEWATLFALLGGEVSLVEMLPAVVPLEDSDVSRTMRRILIQQGVQIHLETRVVSIAKARGGLRVELGTDEGTSEVSATHVLLATGRRPNVNDIGLNTAGVRYGKHGIEVDNHMRTNVAGVYAVGDVNGQKLLAHAASHQGTVAAENALDNEASYEGIAVPACTFTHPEIASVGLTETQARELHGEVLVGRFPFEALGRARAYGDSDGFVKIIAGARYGEVLGMHVIGPAASEIISEGVLAIRLQATLDELRDTVHAHPTFPEATAEAAWMAIGKPLHLPQSRT